jgi:hypothetical protein
MSIIIRFSGTSAGRDFGTCEPMATSEDSFDPGREGRRRENEATGEGMLGRMNRGRGRGTGVPGRVETKRSVFAKIISRILLVKIYEKNPNIRTNLDKTFANI